MVFFTCSACGQAVKKNQVEKHCAFQCRNCQSLSCLDCGKDFWGDDYKGHTKCISEDQKYGGKDYVPKPNSNKGEIKQEKWIEHIKNTIATKKLSGPLSSLLNQIIEYPNIPRKQAKFKNFLENSLRVRNPSLISQTWEIFAQSTKNDSNNNSNVSTKENCINGNTLSTKRPIEDPIETPGKKIKTDETPSLKNADTFDWCGECKKILEKCPSGLTMKSLRKQVVSKFKEYLGTECSLPSSDLKKKFREIVSNNEMFVINANDCK